MSIPLYPLFARLEGRPVLVVGGGAVARRKVAALREAGARVTVGAPALEPELARLATEGTIAHHAGAFDPAWLDAAWLVVAATDDRATNHAVAEAANARRLWVNVVDDVELSSFHVPALVRRGPLQVAISSGGGAPVLARLLRSRIESLLDASWSALAELLSRKRAVLRARLPEPAHRRRWVERLLAGEVPRLLRARQPAAAERAFDAALRNADAPHAGTVALVGAGPGDPGLLTLHALRALGEADVVVHDALVSDEVLALARRDADFIDAGKRAGGVGVTQEDIHATLLALARAGKRVVRLKGGDPFVFGRGGEELQFLRAHGIAYEVVPGITAALACAAYAGVPLTHRGHASSLRLLTAHGRDGADGPDWLTLARATHARETLAVYMGVAGLARLRDGLLAHGGRADLPFALIEQGSRPGQRVIAGILSELPELARRHAVASPALLILGDVAALARELHWFGTPPLGAPPQAASLADAA